MSSRVIVNMLRERLRERMRSLLVRVGFHAGAKVDFLIDSLLSPPPGSTGRTLSPIGRDISEFRFCQLQTIGIVLGE